jgi:hypothetical protein
MSVPYKSVLTTLTAAALIVVGLDYVSFAATGNSFILGRNNTTDATTRLVKRGPGPALVLKSRGNSEPSLRVTSRARVGNLNADLVDGLHASNLASRAVTYRVGRPGDVVTGAGAWSLPPTRPPAGPAA